MQIREGGIRTTPLAKTPIVTTLIVFGGVGYYLIRYHSLDRLQDKKKTRAAMPAFF
jgi:hypothetical protein